MTRVLVLLASLTGLTLLFILQQTALLDLKRYQPRIVHMLTKITGHPVQLKTITYNPLAGLFTFKLLNLEVDAQDPGDPPLLTVQEVRVDIKPLSLIQRQPQLASLTLVGPQVNLVLRHGTHLLKMAQNTAVQSDEKMVAELGLGLANLTLDQITVQEGSLAILDWEHPESHIWVIDHLQINIRDLSPKQASPVAASALFKSVPFTINGQIGPLPESLNPIEMPILLSLEAKSTSLKDLDDFLSTTTLKTQVSRVFLTTLLHGTLSEGLQTSSWIQLDKVSCLPTPIPSNSVTPTSAAKNLRSSKTDMDIALRQKSLFKGDWSHDPILELKEFFIYLDGSPVIEGKGQVSGGWRGALNLRIKILDTIDLKRVPLPKILHLEQKTPSGTLSFHGQWSDSMAVKANLDFTQTAIRWPPLYKASGVPLALALDAKIQGDKIHIKKAVLSHTEFPAHSLQVSGVLGSTFDFQATGNWDAELLSLYFPRLAPWQLSGMLALTLSAENSTHHVRAKGSLTLTDGSLKNLEWQKLTTNFQYDNNTLRLHHFQGSVAGGIVQGYLFADLSPSIYGTMFDAVLSIAGPSIEQLPIQDEGDAPRLEGLLFGQLTIHGQLDDDFLPTSPFFGRANLRLESGRLEGIDQTAFLQPPKAETNISDPKKSLFWHHATTDLVFDQKKVEFKNLYIDAGKLKLTGEGVWDTNETRLFDLQVQTNWGKSSQATFPIHLEGDGITRGFRLKTATKR